MTQNEVNIIKNSVLDATEAYVDARLGMADFVKTQIGVVTANPTKDSDGKYRHIVKCNATSGSAGITYNNVLSVGNIGFPIDSVVFLIAPNAQYSNQFILGKLDSSPANIVGGEIHIGQIPSGVPHPSGVEYYFNVDNNGNINVCRGSINLDYNSNLEDYNFKVDSNGINLGITGTTSSNKYYNFSVNSSGQVTIRNGSIQLGYTTGTYSGYNVDINSTGMGLGWDTNNNRHNFSVSNSGQVTIRTGSISLGWNSTLNKYLFSVDNNGSLYSASGTIGGFNIDTDKLYSGNSARLSSNIISCGNAGNGLAGLQGNNNNAFMQVGASGSFPDNTCIDGIRIYYNGNVQHYDSNGSADWSGNLEYLPRKTLTYWADGTVHYID